MEKAIKLEGLVKTFGKHRAVDGLGFEVSEGGIFGLLGRNGAGKTTTIRMIMDIIRPDTGRIEVLGRTMANGAKDLVGYLPEERGLYPKMKVLEMLEFHGSLKGLTIAEARRRSEHWLERLELGNWKHSKVEELSKGMQQKAQFVSTVISEPKLMILDEPFSGMDPVNQNLFKDLLLELNRKGTTIVLSTHVMDSAERLCGEIALIDDGRAVLHGPLEEIKARFGTNAVQLEFDGDGEFLATVPGVASVQAYPSYVEIDLEPGADSRQLLVEAAARLHVRRFEVVTPTLHNIFVQQVGPENGADKGPENGEENGDA